MTRDEFIEKARLKHGDRYDYSKVEYSGCKNKVIIICPIHGEFWQIPNDHLNGTSCPECSKITGSNKRIKSTEHFINKAKLIHGDKYDYSNTIYVNNRSVVYVICPEHGEFKQKANSHTNGQGCAKCAGQYMNTEYFIQKAKLVHGDKYDYSKVEYKFTDKEVCIGCVNHGEFFQTPNNHLTGYGCPKCAGNYMDLDYFIEKSNKKHHNKYDYSKVSYSKNEDKVCIICLKHGEFWQSPHHHTSGQGCPICKESEGEKIIRQFLLENKISFEYNYKFTNCKYKRKLPFDFYISQYNTCIEYDGRQHFEPIRFFGGTNGFEKLKIKDKIKTQYCLDNNIKLIRIPYTKIKNIEYIIKKELNL